MFLLNFVIKHIIYQLLCSGCYNIHFKMKQIDKRNTIQQKCTVVNIFCATRFFMRVLE